MIYEGPTPRELTAEEKRDLTNGTIPQADENILSYMSKYKISQVTQLHIRRSA